MFSEWKMHMMQKIANVTLTLHTAGLGPVWPDPWNSPENTCCPAHLGPALSETWSVPCTRASGAAAPDTAHCVQLFITHKQTHIWTWAACTNHLWFCLLWKTQAEIISEQFQNNIIYFWNAAINTHIKCSHSNSVDWLQW